MAREAVIQTNRTGARKKVEMTSAERKAFQQKVLKAHTQGGVEQTEGFVSIPFEETGIPQLDMKNDRFFKTLGAKITHGVDGVRTAIIPQENHDLAQQAFQKESLRKIQKMNKRDGEDMRLTDARDYDPDKINHGMGYKTEHFTIEEFKQGILNIVPDENAPSKGAGLPQEWLDEAGIDQSDVSAAVAATQDLSDDDLDDLIGDE